MEEIKQIDYNKSDELDLITLAEKALYFLRRFGKTIVLFLIAGLGCGLLFYFVTPKQYSSRLILRTNLLTNQEEIELIETWKDLLHKGEYSAVAKILDCNAQMLKKVSDITATEIQKLYIQNNPNGLIVDVMVKDTTILDDLQNAIVYGLGSSNYVQERITVKKANLNDLIQKIEGEITKLDSTKTDVQNIMSNRNKNTSSLLIDVSNINVQWMGLNEKLHGYQEELRFINAVQVIQNFNKVRRPEKPKLSASLLFGLITGGFIGYAISVIKLVNQKIKNRAASPLHR